MATQQVWNKYMEALEEIREFKTVLTEKDEALSFKDATIARLRRALNAAENKIDRLEQIMDPNMFLASR
jgi:phage shock protein A